MNYRKCQIYQSKPRRMVFDNIDIAENFIQRLFGLLHKQALDDCEGLLLKRTRAIHMIGMKRPLDVLFLSRQGRILKLSAALQPWQFAAAHAASHTLEVEAGAIMRHGLRQGMKLEIIECTKKPPTCC